MPLKLKRVYDAAAPTDGHRVLVDRLWPRGVSKASLKLDEWLKELAPSHELRKRFHHAPERWAEFERSYFEELDQHQELLGPLLKKAQVGNVTLLFAAKDETHDNALALLHYLAKKVHR
jgi:uncharacterized protein YeaO (DUF488 family)